MGNRVAKHVYAGSVLESSTYYVRDAQGNVMGVYEHKMDAENAVMEYKLIERNIYGSAQVGICKDTVDLNITNAAGALTQATYYHARQLNHRQYSLSNHLGNVLTTIGDGKAATDSNSDGVIDYYTAYIISVSDYSPFGVELANRSWSIEEYRNGFQKQEKDKELWEGAMYYKYRVEDPRLGRFFSVDPKIAKEPAWSSYRAFFCNPIRFIDPDGQWEWDTWGNLVAQKGDNQLSLMLFLGTDYVNSKDLLSRNGVTFNSDNNANITQGQTLAKDNLWVESKPTSGPVIYNTADAVAYYYVGRGKDVDVGDATTNELLNSSEFKKANYRITNGLSELDHGYFKVDLTFSTFHVGTTQVKYDVSTNGRSNSVTYQLFYSNVWGSDGYWDPDYLDENTLGKIPYIGDWTGTTPDGPGPNLERGGTPYHYKTRERTYFYKPPNNK
jgi:RHS repeat-associated protein